MTEPPTENPRPSNFDESGDQPTSASPSGGSGSGSKKDRDLIEAAIQFQTPFEESAAYSDELPPPDAFQGYEILREIHRGGQGVVYLAIQRTTKRRVAIKLMHSGPFLGSKGRARFEREVQVLGQLNHPNIVRIHDSGVTKDGSFFYVMDYISGRTLGEHIKTKDLDENEILKLFGKICQGVNAAHLKGVIHRDIKPANIRVDQNGEPIIVDFGLAKLAIPDAIGEDESAREVMSMTGQFIGSLPWASPEQAEGAPGNIDVRTDVYSLGVVLYQMLTGRFPYEVIGNMRDVLDRILKSEPVRPSTVRRTIGDEVETIVLKCLRKERDRRYQNAGDVARDIERFLSGQPIDAKSDSGWYVISKTLSQYRTPVGVGIGFIVVVMAFSLVMSVLYKQKSHAEAQARASFMQAEERRLQAEASTTIALNLSQAVLYDFPPAISKLVGSTQARRTLLTTLESQIQKINELSPGDPAIRAMLADAYEGAADLQSGLSIQSTGTLDQAEANYDRSLVIRREILTQSPSWKSAAALGKGLLRKSLVQLSRQNFDQAEQLAREALQNYQAALDATPPEAELLSLRRGRLECDVRITDATLRRSERGNPEASRPAIEAAVGRYQAISKQFQALLAEFPQSSEPARWVGILSDKQAMAMLTFSSRLLQQGRRLNEERTGAGESSFQQALAIIAQARQLAVSAGEEFDRLIAAYPTNGELKRDRWLAWYMAGSACADEGRIQTARADNAGVQKAWAQSKADMDRALVIADELLVSDPVNLEAKRDVTGVLLRRGNAFRELAKVSSGREKDALFAAARNDFARCVSMRESIVSSDPMQQHRRDLAAGLYKVAEIAVETGDMAGATEFAQRSKREVEALIAEGAMKSENPELREVLQIIERAAQPR